MGKTAEKFQGSAVIAWKDDEDPGTALLTRIAIAAIVSGCDLISDKGFSCSYAADADTEEALEASRSVTWLWNDKKKAKFRPAFAEETIDIQEFRRRFESPTWYLENPDHPIAYMRHFLDKLREHLETIRNSPPALRHVRGSLVVQALATATDEEIEALFAAAIDGDS